MTATNATHIVLLLEGKDYEQETLAKASRLAQGMGAELALLHLTHSSKMRSESLSLSEEERSVQGELDAKAIISELIAPLEHPVDYHSLVVDDVVPDLKRWLASHPADLLLVGSRHHWMEGSLARLLIYKLPLDIQICHEPYSERLKAVS